jgi:hypothetical protein
MPEFEIQTIEASYWWRKNIPAGALLNNLMFLFIVVPIGLVIQQWYVLSFVVFSFIVPYGFFLRHLAVKAVRRHLSAHPEAIDEFEREGIIS